MHGRRSNVRAKLSRLLETFRDFLQAELYSKVMDHFEFNNYPGYEDIKSQVETRVCSRKDKLSFVNSCGKISSNSVKRHFKDDKLRLTLPDEWGGFARGSAECVSSRPRVAFYKLECA